MPALKGIKMGYLYNPKRRTCTQCYKLKRVGILFIHEFSRSDPRLGFEQSPANHWLCEQCANCSLANLPPQTLCMSCLRIPKALYCTPPLAGPDGRIVSEGYRR